MQAATNDTTDPALSGLVAKNSDGEQGPRTAWRREDGIFTPCHDFDWDELDNDPEQPRQAVNPIHKWNVFSGDAQGNREEPPSDGSPGLHGFTGGHGQDKPRPGRGSSWVSS
jgi:hypothetical protein